MSASQLFHGIISGERRRGRDEIADRADRIASGLQKLGVKQGDSVAMLMRNDIAFIEAAYAAMRLGAYGVPVNWHFKPEEINYVLKDSGTSVLIAHADMLHQLREAIPSGVTALSVPTPPEILANYKINPEHLATPDFAIDFDGQISDASHLDWNERIVVPFAPETPLSGINDTRLFKACWYRKTFAAPKLSNTTAVGTTTTALLPLLHWGPLWLLESHAVLLITVPFASCELMVALNVNVNVPLTPTGATAPAFQRSSGAALSSAPVPPIEFGTYVVLSGTRSVMMITVALMTLLLDSASV